MTEPLTQRIHQRPALPEALRAHLRSARELDRELREGAGQGAFPTAVPVLDRLLAGGLPRGQLVELVGSRTSGRFSTLLAALAAATGVGEAAALVDLGDGLDPKAAAALGIDLKRLLWARPARMKEALAAAEMLLAGGFPLVAIDLGLPPVRGGRGIESAWLRLARAARAHDAALLVGSPYRVTGTAAGAVLQAGRGHAAWRGGGVSPGCSTASPRASSWRSTGGGSPARAWSCGCWWRICLAPPCRRGSRRAPRLPGARSGRGPSCGPSRPDRPSMAR